MDTVLKWGNPLHKPYPLFLLGLGVITIYIPGIIGGAIPTGWLFLCLTIPFFILYADIKLGLGFIFICYAALSLLWVKSLNISFFYFVQLLALAGVYVIGQNIKDIKIIFKGLALGLGVSSIAAIYQYLGNHSIYSLNDAVAGFFINPNIYSEISAILLIGLIVLKLWVWIPVTLPGLILVQSRAAMLGLAVGLLFYLWQFNRKLAIGLTLTLCLTASYFYWGRFDLSSIYERFNLWADTIQGFKFFGNGIGSYETMFPFYATHLNTEIARPKFAHNDLLQAIFEFGVGSIFIILAVLNVFNSKKKETIILYTILVISFFTYPLHVPATSFIAFLVAGYINSNITTNRNFWFDWRPALSKRIIQPRFT